MALQHGRVGVVQVWENVEEEEETEEEEEGESEESGRWWSTSYGSLVSS